MRKFLFFICTLLPFILLGQAHYFSTITFDAGGSISQFNNAVDSVAFNNTYFHSAIQRKYNSKIGEVVTIPKHYNDKMSYPGCRQAADGLKPTKPQYLFFNPSDNVIWCAGGNEPGGGGVGIDRMIADTISSYDTITGLLKPTVFSDAISVATDITIKRNLLFSASYPTITTGNNYLSIGNSAHPHTVQIWGSGTYDQTMINSHIFAQNLSGSSYNYFEPNGLSYIAQYGSGTFAVGSASANGYKFYVNGTSKLNGSLSLGSVAVGSSVNRMVVQDTVTGELKRLPIPSPPNLGALADSSQILLKRVGQVTSFKHPADTLNMPGLMLLPSQNASITGSRSGRSNTFSRLNLWGYYGQMGFQTSHSNTSNVVDYEANIWCNSTGAMATNTFLTKDGYGTTQYYLSSDGLTIASYPNWKTIPAIGQMLNPFRGLYIDSLVYFNKLPVSTAPQYAIVTDLNTNQLKKFWINGAYEPANANIQSHISSAHQAIISGTGFVKASGTTISFDNSTYLTTTGSAAGLTSFPNLNQNTSGTAAGLSSTLAVASGGTGATTLNAFRLVSDKVPLFGTAVDSTMINTTLKFPIGFSNGIVMDTLKCIATTTASGGTVNVTPKVWYGQDISATGTAVITSPSAVTSKSTATAVYTFDQATIAKGNIIWLTFSSVTTKPRNIMIQLIGHKQ